MAQFSARTGQERMSYRCDAIQPVMMIACESYRHLRPASCDGRCETHTGDAYSARSCTRGLCAPCPKGRGVRHPRLSLQSSDRRPFLTLTLRRRSFDVVFVGQCAVQRDPKVDWMFAVGQHSAVSH